MADKQEVSVSDAAERLGLTRRRVLMLIADGKLDAQRIGNSWVVDVASLGDRARRRVGSGRHLSPARAWGLLFLADGFDAPWLDNVSVSKLRSHLKRRSINELSPRLDARGQSLYYRAHPSDIAQLAREPDLMLSGGSGAEQWSMGLTNPEQLDAYASSERIRSLVGKYALEPSREGNVVLRQLPDLGRQWTVLPVAPRSAVALDLANDRDPRARMVGDAVLSEYEH